MSARTVRRVAFGLAVTALAMDAISLILLIPNLPSLTTIHEGSTSLGTLVLGVTYPVVGWLIVSRRPENPIGWIFVVVGLSQSIVALATQYAVYGLLAQPDSLPYADFASWVTVWAWVPGITLLMLLVLVFPDGHLPSARWRPVVWIAVAALPLTLVAAAIAMWPYRGPALLADESPDTSLDPLAAAASTLQIVGALLILLVAMAAMAGVIVRFRRSTGIERQQLKWFAAAGVVEIPLVWIISGAVIPAPFDAIVAIVIAPLVPIATAIAILRYRLYEIDRIISRTISYALITGVLAALFIGVTLVVGALLTSVAQGSGPSSQGRTIAVAASTLIVFALFQPLRRRVQRAVDRRFDRARFDAERTTTAFSERLREEVDLATVTADLNRTVRGAISPQCVGVWLREGGRR